MEGKGGPAGASRVQRQKHRERAHGTCRGVEAWKRAAGSAFVGAPAGWRPQYKEGRRSRQDVECEWIEPGEP